jgi:hypothetical protein
MNPTPSDNQNLNQTPQQPQDQTPQVPQLENETPLDITIYPSNENNQNPLEPQKVTDNLTKSDDLQTANLISEPINSIAPNPIPELNPVSDIVEKSQTVEVSQDQALPTLPTLNTQTPIETTNPVVNQFGFDPVESHESKNINPDIQKIAIIGGAIIGVILVAVLSYSLLAKPQNITESKPSEVTQKQVVTKISNPEPENPVISLQDYQAKISAIDVKYQSIFTSNPMNLDKASPSLKTIEFIGNEIFALADEVNQINVTSNLRAANSKYYNNLMSIVNHLDKVLKTFKESNSVDMKTRNEFLMELQKLQIQTANTVIEIKNLK